MITKEHQEILDSIADGEPMYRAVRRYPSIKSAQKWIGLTKADAELGEAYATAQQAAAYRLVDEAKEIADDPEEDPQRARNRIDIRKWTASKIGSKVFGERLDIEVTAGVNIRAAMIAAEQRVTPVTPMLPPSYTDAVAEPIDEASPPDDTSVDRGKVDPWS